MLVFLIILIVLAALFPFFQVAYKYFFKLPLNQSAIQVWVGKDEQGRDLYLILPPEPDDQSLKSMAEIFSRIRKNA